MFDQPTTASEATESAAAGAVVVTGSTLRDRRHAEARGEILAAAR